jgi:hypothetical protein
MERIYYLADYNSFEETDSRKVWDTTETNRFKGRITFGQQYNAAGDALPDRQKTIIYLESRLLFRCLLEISGVRVIKFIPDMTAEDVPEMIFHSSDMPIYC